MATMPKSPAMILAIGSMVAVLALMASIASSAEPGANSAGDTAGKTVNTGNVEVSKPSPEGRPWRWDHFRATAIESKDRKLPAWIKGPEGAKHPVILFEPDDLPKIRSRLKKGAGPRIMQHLRRHAAGEEVRGAEEEGLRPDRLYFIRRFAESRQIMAAGLYAMLADDAEVTTDAIAKLIDLCRREIPKHRLKHGFNLHTMALGYDLLYNFMTPEQRQIVRNAIDRSAQSMYFHRPWGGDRSGGNWVGHCWVSLGLAGLALQEENHYAPDWIRQGRVASLMYMYHTFDPEGADYEAFSRYFVMGISKVVIFCAAERRQGWDLFPYKGNVFSRIMEFAAYMLLPGMNDYVAFDDAFPGYVDYPGFYAEIAGLTGDQLAQGVFEATYREPRIHVGEPVTAAVWYDPDIPAEKLQGSNRLPLAKAYWGIPGNYKGEWSSGHVFLRTGFDSPEDILFAAQCGSTGGWHGHADQSSFVLCAYGDVLVQDPGIVGTYNELLCEWMKGPEAHSLVLMDGEATPDYTVADKVDWPRRFGRAGEIDSFIHTETLDFVSMDFVEGLELNPKIQKVMRAKRRVLFFRHPGRTGYFVIVDDLVKDESPHRYEWLLQPDDKHKIAKEGPGQFAFAGRVDLKIRVIEPKEPVHEKATFEGYGVDYLRVRSQEDRTRGLFLTILYPKKKDMTMPEIAEIRRDNVVGAKIGEDIVLFNTKYGSPIEVAGVRSDGELVALRISGKAVKNAIVTDGSWLTLNGGKIPFATPSRRKAP